MPENQVEEIKQKTDIVALIGEYIQLKKAGRNYKATCPFHGEKTPSFIVSPELQIFKCFGCGEAGDAFAFLEKYEGMEFVEALKFLAERAGVKLTPISGRDTGEKEKLLAINTFAGRFYQYFLLNHKIGKSALDYLIKDRGLKLSTIKEFQLGFSPDNPVVLKKFLIDKKKFHPKDVERSGIGYPKGELFIDRFRGRVIFPLYNHRGNIVGFAGRLMPGPREKEMAKYINTPETPIYHKGGLLYGLNLTKSDIKKKETAIVVEGELDAISSWQAGIKNVVAIKGSALTEDQVRLLSRFCKKAILALDSDIAGDAAARKGVLVAQDQGLEVRVATLKDYKDPDEAARKNPEEYKKSLIGSLGIWDFLLGSVFKRYNAVSGTGKAKISKEVVPILSLITDKIVQAHYIGRVAKKLEVSEEAVIQQVSSVGGKEEVNKDKGLLKEKEEIKGRQELLEERLLSLMFRYNPQQLTEKNIAALIKTSLAKKILEEYLVYSKKHKKFDVSKFADKLPKELFNGFAELVLTEETELEDESYAQTETTIVKYELKVFEVKEGLVNLTNKIREFEVKKEKKKLLKAKEEFNKLTEKLHSLEEKVGQGIILDED